MTDNSILRPEGAGDSPVSSARRRPGFVLTAAALVVSLCITAAALIEMRRGPGGEEQVVLDVTRATLDPGLLPTTTAPAEPSPEPSATLPRSPLADLLPEPISAMAAPVESLPVPVGLRIDAIGVEGDPLVPVGIDDQGELAVPDVEQVGWYQLGQRPGQPGATVLAAHVSWKKQAGVFARLGRVEPGDEILVELSDGSERRYIAWERTMYAKTDLPADRIWTREGNEVLVLITCGGDFNREIRRYRQNIVVYAVPVD